MGLMVHGEWQDDDAIPSDARGNFIRAASRFRHWITADGAAGPSGDGGFKAEPGRYHLFVSYNCPWAHRAIIMRKLKKLEDVVSMSLADRPKTEGWSYSRGIDDLQPSADGTFRLHQVYKAADGDYSGKVTVPTLWDRERRTIVNNESSEIIRMLNSAFAMWTDVEYDFYPEGLRHEIDSINDFVYEHLNNGVYRAGFARSQEAYEEAARKVFHGLDTLDERLGRSLSCRRTNHRDGLACLSHPAALRSGLLQSFQMQFAPDSGLSSSGRIFARALSVAGNQRDLRSPEDQGRILQPAKHQSHRYRADRTRSSSPRTAAQACI